MPLSLPATIKAYVFDAYGTLFDVNSAVMRHAQAVGPEARGFSALWRQKQLEYSWVLSLAGRFSDFWTLTERALDYAFASHPGVDRGLRDRLLAAYRELDAYPEVPEALRRLRAEGLRDGHPLEWRAGDARRAIGSAGIGPLLDHVFSVSSVGVFKTDRRAYAQILAPLGAEASEIAFVSSNRWDVAGAAAFGLVPIWVNRSGAPDEYPDLAPAATVTNLAEIG